MIKGAEPELRFPEFSGIWKLTPLSALMKEADNRKVRKPSSEYTELGIRSHGKGFIIRKNTSPNKNVMTHLFEVKAADISINISFAWEGAVALASAEHEGGLVSHRFPLFQANPNLADPNFLHHRFKLSDFTYRLELHSPGGAGRNRVLKKSDLLKSKIYAPALVEQKKITTFLKAVGQKIEALEAQVADWRDFKRGMMQVLFSQRLRFKADDGSDFPDWEDGKVKDFGSFYYGRSAPKWSIAEDAPTPCVRYGELYTKFGSIVKEIFSYTNIPIKNLRISKGGEVLVPRVGEKPLAFANCAYLPMAGIAIGEMISVYETKEHGPFVADYFNSELKIPMAKVVEGANVSNLYYAYVQELEVNFPSVPEQQKIADALSAIDAKVEALTARLEAMREFKRGLLQKMFV